LRRSVQLRLPLLPLLLLRLGLSDLPLRLFPVRLSVRLRLPLRLFPVRLSDQLGLPLLPILEDQLGLVRLPILGDQ
jgi:hypothetical protein